jgi:hypothetical protein
VRALKMLVDACCQAGCRGMWIALRQPDRVSVDVCTQDGIACDFEGRILKLPVENTMLPTFSKHSSVDHNRICVQALKAVADACCQAGCTGIWRALQQTEGASVDVCKQDGIVCDSGGKVLELPVVNAGWQCNVQQLSPLANLTSLRTLELVGMPHLVGVPSAQCILYHAQLLLVRTMWSVVGSGLLLTVLSVHVDAWNVWLDPRWRGG